jgi:hypothetical protein
VNNLVVSHTVGIRRAGEPRHAHATLLWATAAILSSNTAFIIPPMRRCLWPRRSRINHLFSSICRDRGVLTGVTEEVDGDPRPRGKGRHGADETPGGDFPLYLPLFSTYLLPPAPPVLPDSPPIT